MSEALLQPRVAHGAPLTYYVYYGPGYSKCRTFATREEADAFADKQTVRCWCLVEETVRVRQSVFWQSNGDWSD